MEAKRIGELMVGSVTSSDGPSVRAFKRLVPEHKRLLLGEISLAEYEAFKSIVFADMDQQASDEVNVESLDNFEPAFA